MRNQASIILFDGKCMLCNNFISYVMKKNLAIYFFCDLNSATAKTLLEKYSMPTQNFNTIYLIKDNKIYSKSTAVLTIYSSINIFYRILSYSLLLIPKFLRDKIYSFLAKNRHKFFKSKSCYLPSLDQKRFIL